MLILFHHWNNTTEDNETTITDDTEDISTPDQKNNESDRRKVKDKEFSSYEIWKVNMARVEKAVKDDNSMFDDDVTVI